MPLQDRQDFQDWLTRRTENMVGRRHGDAPVCISCGNVDNTVDASECLVCLAESFGIETAEAWLAESIAGFVRAASEPPVLDRMLAELVVHARDIAALHAPAGPWQRHARRGGLRGRASLEPAPGRVRWRLTQL